MPELKVELPNRESIHQLSSDSQHIRKLKCHQNKRPKYKNIKIKIKPTVGIDLIGKKTTPTFGIARKNEKGKRPEVF